MGDSIYGKVLRDTLDQEAYCIQESPYDSSWIVGGYTISDITYTDSNEYILKFKDDSVYWSFWYDYAPGTHDFVSDVATLPNGDSYFVGYTNTSFSMPHITAYRVNKGGYPYLAENLRVHYPAGKTTYTPKIALHHDSAFALLAHSSFYSSNFNDFLFIPLKRPYSIIERDTVVYSENLITSSPPVNSAYETDVAEIVNGSIILNRPVEQLNIYDIQGRKIWSKDYPPIQQLISIKKPDIAEGVYLVEMVKNHRHYLKKIYIHP